MPTRRNGCSGLGPGQIPRWLDFNADAVVWNVHKVLDKAAPHFDPSQVGVTASRMPTLRIARKIDDMTVELTTSEPDSFLPINLTNLFMASPAHWEAKLKAVPASVTDPAERSKQAWAAFAADPSGSGPFRVTRFVSRERLELAKVPEYWDEKRRPKIDKVVLLPLPEANARTAALLSGQVDWIEAPAPDARRRSSSAASRSTRTRSRMSGPGSSPSSRAHPGSTSACATRRTCASTAPR